MNVSANNVDVHDVHCYSLGAAAALELSIFLEFGHP